MEESERHEAQAQTGRGLGGSPRPREERSDTLTDLPRKILSATAGTQESDPELRDAADLSTRTGAPVRVVHVGRDLPTPSHYGPDYNLFANDTKAERRAIGLSKEQAAMIEERDGTVAEVYSQPGKRPGDEIVKNTRDEDVGLVGVGERGMGPFRYGSPTSITATVVREAYLPGPGGAGVGLGAAGAGGPGGQARQAAGARSAGVVGRVRRITSTPESSGESGGAPAP